MEMTATGTSSESFEPRIGRSVSLDQAAQLLGVSRRTIYNRIREGRLQTIRTRGGSQRVLLDSDARFAMRANVTPTSSTRRLSRAVFPFVFLLVAAAAPVSAQHRARLSADLDDHLTAGSQAIDVIVRDDRVSADALAARYSVPVKRRLAGGGAVLRVNAGQLDAMRRDPDVDHLSGDQHVHGSTAVTNVAIGADQVWAGAGGLPSLTGKGVTVAIVDSGIDAAHASLKNRVLATVDFTGGDGADRFGHGTHIAGIIGGQAGKTSETKRLQGVAPGAYLVNLRVLDETGAGVASSVIEAIDWAIAHRRQYNIGVINLSLGGAVTQPPADDPMCAAVERAVRAGITVVAAAGNFGKTQDGKLVVGGITSPGNDALALTVGAVDTHGTPERSDDTVAAYSSRGPTRFELLIKPDVVAPGSHIVSAESAGSYISKAASELHVTGSGANAYIKLSGTSQAAAVASGTVALLLQERPNLSPAKVKAAIQQSATFLRSAGLMAGGAGELNALAAENFVALHDEGIEPVAIAGELAKPTGITTTYSPVGSMTTNVIDRWPIVRGNTIIWGTSNTIIWGTSNTIIWGTSNTIIWGTSNTIIWGTSDTIIWGTSDTIIWGTSDTIIWGT